ncbi:MAG: nucleotidyltransferase family protein [Pyrinomonadaceae bacterium]
MTKRTAVDLTAILLCGGRGERLRPFTESLPKALVPLNGKPLLEHLLNYLRASGVTRFVVCVGYKADAIEEFLKDHKPAGCEIICVNSGDVSMTDRILDARKHASGPVLICYGDTLANVELEGLLVRHSECNALSTLTVYPLHSPFGIVEADDSGQVQNFSEKPQLPFWINIGFLLCEPDAFKYLQPGSDMIGFLSAMAKAGVLFSYRHAGKHLTVNTEKERAAAEAEMVEFYTYIEGQMG